MPVMRDVEFRPARATGPRFVPIGIVLHRTEASYAHLYKSFPVAKKSPHFLVGKRAGEVVQLVDTDHKAAHVGPVANDLYLGIEFESIAARPSFKHRQDPLVNADSLTEFQKRAGRSILQWLSMTHDIPLEGPPNSIEWAGLPGALARCAGARNRRTGWILCNRPRRHNTGLRYVYPWRLSQRHVPNLNSRFLCPCTRCKVPKYWGVQCLQ